MKKSVVMLAFAVLALSLSPVHALTNEEADTIRKAADEFMSTAPKGNYYLSAEEINKRLQSGKRDFVLVDLRIPREKFYDKGHLPGAISIGYTELAKPENLSKLPKDKDIIVYCYTGNEQGKALAILRMLGYKAYGLKWGYMAWKADLPTAWTMDAIRGSIAASYPVE
jgi:rhodanese-related sulfurtransferase